MKIYTERQFRREVEERMFELEKRKAVEDDIGRLYRRLGELEQRVAILEGKGIPVECNCTCEPQR